MSAQPVQAIAPTEYGALLDHCSTCRSCRLVPQRECPRAGALRREWQAASRQAASVGGSR